MCCELGLTGLDVATRPENFRGPIHCSTSATQPTILLPTMRSRVKILSTHRGETTWCVQPPRMLKLSQNLTTIISLTAILARHQRNRPRNLPFYHRVAFRIVYENAQAGRPCLSFPKAHLPQERLEYLTRPHLWKSTAFNFLHLPRWRIRPARPSSQRREVDMVIKT